MKHDKIREVTWIVALTVIAFVILWPLVKPGFVVTDDGDWMIIRLSAFYQSLREGQFPVRFLGRLNFNYGYPVANFLYPGFMYLGSFVHFIGFTFVDSIKVLFIGSVIGSAIFTYLWLRTFFTPLASFFGSLSYIFAPYIVFDIYKRGSIGEVLALFFVCMLLYAVDSGKKWLVSPAFALLLLSHNTLGLLFAIVIGGYIIYTKKIWLFVPIVIGLGMATFFWAPALYEKKYVVFDKTTVSNPFSYFASGETIYLLGYTILIAWVCTFFLKYQKYNNNRQYFLLVCGLAVFLATPLSAPLWNWNILGKIVQFPFRFLALNVIFGTWLLAYTVSRFSWFQYAAISIFILLSFFQILPVMHRIQFEEKEEGFYTTNEATTTVADEYMPKWTIEVPRSRSYSEIEVYDGMAKILSHFSTTQTIRAVIQSEGESIVQINSLYYPGWGVLVNNQRVPIEYDNPKNPFGLIRFEVPSGTHEIFAQFRETVPRFIANVVSFLFFILYLVYITQKYHWEKINNDYT